MVGINLPLPISVLFRRNCTQPVFGGDFGFKIYVVSPLSFYFMLCIVFSGFYIPPLLDGTLPVPLSKGRL
jgi:hypothetical protein